MCDVQWGVRYGNHPFDVRVQKVQASSGAHANRAIAIAPAVHAGPWTPLVFPKHVYTVLFRSWPIRLSEFEVGFQSKPGSLSFSSSTAGLGLPLQFRMRAAAQTGNLTFEPGHGSALYPLDPVLVEVLSSVVMLALPAIYSGFHQGRT